MDNDGLRDVLACQGVQRKVAPAIRLRLILDGRHRWNAVHIGEYFRIARTIGCGRLGVIRVVRRVRRGCRWLRVECMHRDRHRDLWSTNDIVRQGSMGSNPGNHWVESELRAIQDQLAELRDGNSLGRVTLENAAQDANQVI